MNDCIQETATRSVTKHPVIYYVHNQPSPSAMMSGAMSIIWQFSLVEHGKITDTVNETFHYSVSTKLLFNAFSSLRTTILSFSRTATLALRACNTAQLRVFRGSGRPAGRIRSKIVDRDSFANFDCFDIFRHLLLALGCTIPFVVRRPNSECVSLRLLVRLQLLLHVSITATTT